METTQPTNPATPSIPVHETSWGTIVGIIIVVIVLAVGSLYFWGKEVNDRQNALPAINENVTAQDILGGTDPTTEALKQQDTSDAIGSIEKDVNATDLTSVDAETNNIDAEISR
ncbi:MAG: hypothetical protein HGA67_01665 [Candidatus Yonathbacteria bacterium]|nr:hypothetical protein [Candidatus Yonathbacteria bacterium]